MLAVCLLLLFTGGFSNYALGKVFKSQRFNSADVRVHDGFLSVVSGSEQLLNISLDGDSVDSLKKVVDGCMDLIKVNILELGISEDSLLRMGMVRDGFKYRLHRLIRDFKSNPQVFKSVNNDGGDLVSGLTSVVYNVLSVLVENDDLGVCFSNMLGGAYKVVTSILSENKINSDDLQALMDAFDSVFSFDEYSMLDCE